MSASLLPTYLLVTDVKSNGDAIPQKGGRGKLWETEIIAFHFGESGIAFPSFTSCDVSGTPVISAAIQSISN
jgi:hypothetical protein